MGVKPLVILFTKDLPENSSCVCMSVYLHNPKLSTDTRVVVVVVDYKYIFFLLDSLISHIRHHRHAKSLAMDILFEQQNLELDRTYYLSMFVVTFSFEAKQNRIHAIYVHNLNEEKGVNLTMFTIEPECQC